MKPPRLVSLSLSIGFACGLSFVTGCAGPRQGPPGAAEHPMPRQPSLAGDASFFAKNGVDVHVTLDGAAFAGAGPDGGSRRGAGDSGTPRKMPPRNDGSTDEMVNMGPGMGGGGDSGMGSRGGGGMGRGGGGGFDGPRDGPPPGSEGDGPRGGGGGGQPGFAPVHQVLRVVFTNHGPSNAELTVVEVKSVLGDFAPRPEHFTLAAGQSAPLNEMRSGVAENVEQLDVTITLRRGNERETKVVRLAGVSPTPPPPPSQPAPPQ